MFHCRVKTQLSTLPKALWIMKLKTALVISSPVWSPEGVASNRFWYFFHSLRSFPYIPVIISTQRERDLCRSLEFSLFIALSPPGICPENPTALYSLDSRFHLINTRRLPGSTWTPVCAMASKLSLYIKMEKSWSSLCSFPITQCHCLSFPEAQYLKNHHFIYFNDF